MKLPPRRKATLLVRGEHEFDGPPPPRRPPEAAVDLLRAYVRDRPLGPSLRLRTVRRSVELADELGRPASRRSTDDEVSVMRRAPGRFAVPRARGRARHRDAGGGRSPACSDGCARRAPGPSTTCRSSCARSAAGGRAPEVVVEPGSARTPTVADVVRRALAASVGAADPPRRRRAARRRPRGRAPGARRDSAPALGPADVPRRRRARLGDGTAGGARWLGAELGAVRDAEVLRERLRGRVGVAARERSASRRRADRRLDRRHDAAREELVAAMREPRYTRLLDALVVAADAPAAARRGGGRARGRGAPAGPRVALEAHRHRDGRRRRRHDGREPARRADPGQAGALRGGGGRARVRQARTGVRGGRGGRAGCPRRAPGRGGRGRVAARGGRRGRRTRSSPASSPRSSRRPRRARARRWPAAWKALSRKRLRFWA